MASDFIAALKEEYVAALKTETDAKSASVKAEEAHQRARDYRQLTERLLVSKGIDPQALKPKNTAQPKGIEQFGLVPDGSTNGALPRKPVHSTHLVYLLIRKHGNTGYLPTELEQMARALGYDLPAAEVMKIYWKQSGLKRMERVDEKIKLTTAGEGFDNFRIQKIGDKYEPTIPVEAIK